MTVVGEREDGAAERLDVVNTSWNDRSEELKQLVALT